MNQRCDVIMAERIQYFVVDMFYTATVKQSSKTIVKLFNRLNFIVIYSTLQQEIKNEVNQHNRRRKELLYNYISILYETGIRPVELRALTWKNYVADYGEGGLFVNVYSRKQNNKRNIALSPNLVKLLNNLYQQQKEFCRQHNLPFNDEDINIISLCNGNETKNHFCVKICNFFYTTFI